jgi:hypothetical protein
LAEFAAVLGPFASSDGKNSVQRIARVLKVSHVSTGPGFTLPLDSSLSPVSDSVEVAGRFVPTRGADVGPGHPSVKTGMVWGSQTGSGERRSRAGLIIGAALAGSFLVLAALAVLVLWFVRRPHPTDTSPVVAVESPPAATAPMPSAAPAPPPAPPVATTATPIEAIPIEPKPAPSAPKSAQPSNTAQSKSSSSSSKPSSKPASKDLPFSGRF